MYQFHCENTDWMGSQFVLLVEQTGWTQVEENTSLSEKSAWNLCHQQILQIQLPVDSVLLQLFMVGSGLLWWAPPSRGALWVSSLMLSSTGRRSENPRLIFWKSFISWREGGGFSFFSLLICYRWHFLTMLSKSESWRLWLKSFEEDEACNRVTPRLRLWENR